MSTAHTTYCLASVNLTSPYALPDRPASAETLPNMAASKEDSEFSKIIRGTIEAAPTSPKFASSHSDYQDQDQDGTPDLEILLDSGPIGMSIQRNEIFILGPRESILTVGF